MDDLVQKWILTMISVVLVATLVGSIVWTVNIGGNIISDYQSNEVKLYSEAGLSVMINQYNLDDVDSISIYKMLEMNKSIINDYKFKTKTGANMSAFDLRNLINNPLDRYEIENITGDSNSGYTVIIKAKQ
jgi:hypothetical protein